MNLKNLNSLLSVVDLRNIWPNESTDFTVWLAKPDNLSQLSNYLGLNLALEGREVQSGRFRTDILAKDVDADIKVIIENQLEKSNHSHLGQCLTYMSYHDAKYCIWIAKEFCDEHLNAIRNLNEKTTCDYRFYAVEIKVYKVCQDFAYVFNVVEKPDYIYKYQQGISENTHAKSMVYNQFWELFRGRMPNELQPHVRIQYSGKPYINMSFDNQPFWMNIGYDEKLKQERVGITTNNKDTYNKLDAFIKSGKCTYNNANILKVISGTKNTDWHSFREEHQYVDEVDIAWLVKTATAMYESFRDIQI